MGHEIAHITNGHLAYLYPGMSQAFLSEFGAIPSDPAGRFDRQVLEWDADAMAASAFGIGPIRRRVANSQIATRPKYFSDPGAAVRAWQAAVSTFFLMFGTESFVGVDLGAIPYPPTPLRCFYCMGVVELYTRLKWDANLHDTVVEASARGYGEAARAFEIATGSRVKINEGIRESFDPAVWSTHLDRLNDAWKTRIRAALEPVAFNKNLPE
jgi:hypothetical protein